MSKPTRERKSGYSGATIEGTLGTLSLVMSKAYRKGYAPNNPVKQLEKDERPKIKQSPKRVLSADEIERLLKTSGETFAPIVATMIFTGLRLGEVLGLRWESIDRDEGYIYVRHQLSRKRELVKLKTEAAQRDVVPSVLETLSSRRPMANLATTVRRARASNGPLPGRSSARG
jgi:integrase